MSRLTSPLPGTRGRNSIAQLGYVRNEFARQMPAGQNHAIAIVGLDVTALFTDVVLAEAARAAAAADAPSDDDRSH